jgi:peptidyl-prolyl cis-trans isomerase C
VTRWPALHFVVLGAVVLALQHGWSRGAVATAALSDDELLYRAAVAQGVDRRDPAVRLRLAKLATFVGEDGAEAAETARRLGLDRGDVVVRRHLAQMMELAAAHAGDGAPPTDAELRGWMAAHPDRVRQPARVRFVHVYLARGRHAADAPARLLAALRAGGVAPAAAAARGDAFPGGAVVGPATLAELSRRFGPAFAAALAEAPLGAWTGPVATAWGVHLVEVTERLPARMPALDEVRGRVVQLVLREREAASVAARLAALRAGG